MAVTNRAHRVQFAISRGCARRSAASRRDVELPANIQTVADLVGWLKQRGPQYGEAFARPQVVRAALDKVHVKPTAISGRRPRDRLFPARTGG